MRLHVHRLNKMLDSRTILHIDELCIEAGEIHAIVGPIGSGKTLLLRTLAGVLPPSGGRVEIEGKDIYRDRGTQRNIAVLFEEDLLYERLSIRDNLKLYCGLHRLPRESIDNALAEVELSDQARKSVAKVSPPTKRRVAFARLLMGQPKLLLLDHPTLRIDRQTHDLFSQALSQAAQQGASVILTCEDLSWAGKFCTHIVELAGGQIVEKRRNEALNTSQTKAGEPPATPERHVPYKVPARKEDRIMLFDPGEILYATSRDGKIYLRTASDEATTNLTLQELEQRLLGRGFFKAHRAYLVNLQHIKAVIQYTRNSYTLLLNDAQETMIPLSKQSEKELQELLSY
ncbi:ATP-binding cassette domain-containing protein [Ktedonospora formicarum]|uniref:Transcriptional regulator n=1 Tax=Ktedonospora formicarum TaxID=2778364 RepID=A0A8J3I058_9CHLR|nr:ATP-binding cassette domain-containing protein [Ktedonospora formicarum]GHO43683.1 transcriptional regulator [Ktedonospora formicarum]